MSDLDNIVVLNDADGNEIQFEFLDLIEYCEKEYVVLLPADDEDADQVVILEVVTVSEEEEEYISVEDEDILNEVFQIFKEKFADEFNFED